MPERQYRTLSKRIVDRLAVNGKDAVFWDSDLPGFGVRVYPSGQKVYVVQTRSDGKSRRVAVGRHGDIAPDEARRDAAKLLARIKAGLPPVETEPEAPPTVADLAERYRREYVAMHCKPLTVKHYGLMLHYVAGHDLRFGTCSDMADAIIDFLAGPDGHGKLAEGQPARVKCRPLRQLVCRLAPQRLSGSCARAARGLETPGRFAARNASGA